MEIKDLILLLLIPILLIGILSYANSITGAAVVQKSNKIGEYSVLPSFKVHIDNSLGEYKELKMKLKSIINICKEDDMEKCLEKEAGIKWKCDEKEEKMLYMLADSLNDCAKVGGRAICSLSFEEIKGINEMEDSRDFEIKIINFDGKIKAELREKGRLAAEENVYLKNILYTDFNSRDESKNHPDSIAIKIRYEDDKPSIQKFVAVKDGKEIKLSNGFIYRTSEEVKFIDHVFEDSFKGAKPEIKTLKVPFTRGMKFCAKSSKEVFIQENGKLERKNIVYKFSVTFPNPIPPPIENFEAADAVNAEKSSVLSWDSSEAKSYNLYYSSKNFIDIPMDDIKKDNDIIKISLEKKSAAEIDDITLSECRFDPYGAKCKYSSYGQSLEPGKLYYWKSNDKYIYYLDEINDGQQYYAAITAVDDEGNELDNDKSKENNKMLLTDGKNYVQFSSKDDLAPMKIIDLNANPAAQKLTWTKPLKNADGSDSIDISYFNIYYKKSASALGPNIEPGYAAKRITPVEANCANQAMTCEFSVSNIPNLDKSIYSFAVTALDENLNEISEADVKQMLIS